MSDMRKTFYVGHTSDGSINERPMSPHLEVYKPYLSMVLSISNRITGAALAGGSTLAVAWLASAAKGPRTFGKVQKVAGSLIGQTVLFGCSSAFFLHFIGGLRHLMWDSCGHRLEKDEINQDSKTAVVATTALTLGLWTIIFGRKLKKKK